MTSRNGNGNRNNVGWIKIHRKILGWEWYKNTNISRVFIHLLIKAAHNPTRYNGIDLLAGQLITSRRNLARDLGLSEREIRTVLATLKRTQELTIKATHSFSIITICRWDIYQGRESINDPVNDPESAHEMTTFKKYKEVKEDFISPFSGNGEKGNKKFKSHKGIALTAEKLESFQKFWEIFDLKIRRDEAERAWSQIQDLTPELCEKIYKAAAAEAKRAPELDKKNQNRKHAAGWLAGRRWEDEIEKTKKPTVYNLKGNLIKN